MAGRGASLASLLRATSTVSPSSCARSAPGVVRDAGPDLWNVSIGLADVAGPCGDELSERLQFATSWHERFAARRPNWSERVPFVLDTELAGPGHWRHDSDPARIGLADPDLLRRPRRRAELRQLLRGGGVNSHLREFGALMDAWSAAIVADDPEAIGRFAEPDWVLIGENGVFPREQFLDSVATGRITHHMMSHEIHDVRIYGDVAVVLTRGRNTGAYDGEEFELDEWTTEVFVRRDGGWKCSVTHLTAVADGSATREIAGAA